MEKILPEIDIAGTIFQFDIEEIILIQKDRPRNWIDFRRMLDCRNHYEFLYSTKFKNYPGVRVLDEDQDPFVEDDKREIVRVSIPRIAEMDPQGMMDKYGCKPADFKTKSDFEIMVDQEVYYRRVEGEPVTIDICGHKYKVDIGHNVLHSLEGEEHDINLDYFHYDYFIEEDNCYYLYCDMNTGRVVDLLHEPEIDNALAFKVPHSTDLDPIETIEQLRFLSHMDLMYHDVKLEHRATEAFYYINGNSLADRSFRVKQPDLETKIIFAFKDPNFVRKEYSGYLIADSTVVDESRKGVTIIFDKMEIPNQAKIVDFFDGGRKQGEPASGMAEAMKHIDLLIDPLSLAGSDPLKSKLISINEYLRKYHYQEPLMLKDKIKTDIGLNLKSSAKQTKPKL